jgi:hypothetical protein
MTYAFAIIYEEIKRLRAIDENIKQQNRDSLAKAKREIEILLSGFETLCLSGDSKIITAEESRNELTTA